MKKNKRFKVEAKFVGDHECSHWKPIKWFNDFNSARNSCDQTFKKLKGNVVGFDTQTFHYVRVIDTQTNERVYPYQKDKFGNEIIPEFGDMKLN